MWTAKFWKDTSERCVGTSAQYYVGIISANQAADWLDVPKVSWSLLFVGMGVAASVCLAKCLVAATHGDPTNASLVK